MRWDFIRLLPSKHCYVLGGSRQQKGPRDGLKSYLQIEKTLDEIYISTIESMEFNFKRATTTSHLFLNYHDAIEKDDCSKP